MFIKVQVKGLYITIIKIFGVEWYDNSFSKSLQDAMKGKGNKTKMVESALNELTYEQLKEYLFTPFCGRNISEVLEQELSESSVEELSKEEILDIVNQCRSESLWNRFFSEYKQFRNIKEKIDDDIFKERCDTLLSKGTKVAFNGEFFEDLFVYLDTMDEIGSMYELGNCPLIEDNPVIIGNYPEK